METLLSQALIHSRHVYRRTWRERMQDGESAEELMPDMYPPKSVFCVRPFDLILFVNAQ